MLTYYLKKIFKNVDKYFIRNIVTGEYKKIFHLFPAKFYQIFYGLPSTINLEVSAACNLRCPLCPAPPWLIQRKTPFMSYQNFTSIIDKIGKYVSQVNLTNAGEPLLCKDIFKMVNYLSRKGIMSIINTNANLIDEKMLKDLLATKLDYLIISCDGTTPESYSKMRKKGSLDRIIKLLEYLGKVKKRAQKPYIELQFIVNKYNEKEVPIIKSFAKKYAINEVRIKPLSLNEHLYTEEKVKKLAAEYLPEQGKIRQQYVGRLNKKCKMYNHFVILTNGELILCCIDIFGENKFGNLLSQGLLEIWRSPEYKKARQLAKNKKIKLCKKCPVY